MSRSQPFVCFLLILCLVQAATSSLNICVKNYEAKYDELHWEEPFETGNPIPDGYKGLDYNVFQVDRYDGFINPDSGLQYAMSFGGSGNISVHDSGRYSFFSLKSFSYACSGGVPQPECAISMWGFRDGSLVAHQVITYPALEPGHFISEFIMNSTTFDWRWAHLSSVGFSIARADNGGTLYGGLMIDDFRYWVERECNSTCS